MIVILAALLLPFASTSASSSTLVEASPPDKAAVAPVVSSTRYQETSTRIVYRGSWLRVWHRSYSGGQAKRSTVRGSSATFTGTAVNWIGPKGPTRGHARVYINGRYMRTVNTYATSFVPSRVLFAMSFSQQRERTLKIVVVGTPGHPTVAIDAFIVRRTGSTVAPASAAISPPSSGAYPADTSLRYVATSALGRPDYLAPTLDPTWGTTITRVSNTPGVRQAYSRIPAWNSDQTKILLGFTHPGRMLDGTTYAELPWFTGGGNQVPMAIWANTDPNKLYGVSGNTFVSQNATTGLRTTLRTFSAYSSISIGDGEGAIDDNDTYVALIGTTSTGAKHLITYNIQTDTVIADIVAPSSLDNIQISRKGNYVVVVGGGSTTRYARDLSSPIVLYPGGSHGDNALDANGNEIFVVNNAASYVKSFLLSTGSATNLLGTTRTAFEYGHTSGRNIQRPGWIYLSVYNNTAAAGRPGKDQIVAVKTDGSGTVQVFGFAHHSILSYQNEPHAVPSPDGRRVMFASEWGTTGVYAYVAGQ